MSDFFGGLSGNLRFTDARINGDGPLPTTLDGPEGINGDADGRYNFNGSLLSGIEPYAGPKDGRMGSDRNYQQIPHRKQFVVPPVYLPEPNYNTTAPFMMSHGIDMGDIAFILNVRHKRFMLSPGPHNFLMPTEDDSMPNYNIFCNICTVNYLLTGLHNYIAYVCLSEGTFTKDSCSWGMLCKCFDIYGKVDAAKKYCDTLTNTHDRISFVDTFVYLTFQHMVKTRIIPMGICSMSEKQGGQHEVGFKPVQAASSFYTTLTVDGQNRDLVNIWRSMNISAGDMLILKLAPVTVSSNEHKRVFTLNHYYKNTVMRTITMHKDLICVIQLVPDTFSFCEECPNYLKEMDKEFQNYLRQHENAEEMFTSEIFFEKNRENEANRRLSSEVMYKHSMNYRFHGYWHIGQTYTKKNSFSEAKAPMNDLEQMQGQLLQINFAPVWKGIPVSREHENSKCSYFKCQHVLQNLMREKEYARKNPIKTDKRGFLEQYVPQINHTDNKDVLEHFRPPIKHMNDQTIEDEHPISRPKEPKRDVQRLTELKARSQELKKISEKKPTSNEAKNNLIQALDDQMEEETRQLAHMEAAQRKKEAELLNTKQMVEKEKQTLLAVEQAKLLEQRTEQSVRVEHPVVHASPQQPTIGKGAEGAEGAKQPVVHAPQQQPTIGKGAEGAEGAKQPVTQPVTVTVTPPVPVKQSVVKAQPQQPTIVVKGAEATFSKEADFGMELSALFAKKK